MISSSGMSLAILVALSKKPAFIKACEISQKAMLLVDLRRMSLATSNASSIEPACAKAFEIALRAYPRPTP